MSTKFHGYTAGSAGMSDICLQIMKIHLQISRVGYEEESLQEMSWSDLRHNCLPERSAFSKIGAG